MNSQRPVSLPAKASLENLRKRAKTLVKEHAAGDAAAQERVAAVLPQLAEPLALHDAQLVVARERGIASWPKLVQQLDARRPERRVHREGVRVWLDGVPRLRWGTSAEPTYLGALEAAFRGSERPLDLIELMGDSGLCFRVRWGVRAQGQAWCGSGPCGEWPDEVAALNAATGYVFEWNDPEITPADTRERVKASLDRGYPVLAMPLQMDLGVILGYEGDGSTLLVADYWASEFPARVAITDMKQVGCFLDRVQAPAPRPSAVRAGLGLAMARFREGVVEPDPITGASYHYGSAGFERWAADLERAPQLSAEQRQNLFHVSSWTFSGFHQARSKYAGAYLRRAAPQFNAAGSAHVLEAAGLYDQVRDRLGPWDTSDPLFGMVKQKPLSTWTDDVRRREVELLRAVHELEQRAMVAIERALASD
jgi:hypothetical protein